MLKYTKLLTKKNAAFTLAEVLITLGIIGVISAITIPTLIHKYKNDEYVAGMKKAYSILSQAVPKALDDLGAEKFGYAGVPAITGQLKCVSRSWENHVSYGNIEPGSGVAAGNAWCQLQNGMYMHFMGGNDGSNSEENYHALRSLSGYNKVVYSWVMVDINGNKLPNEFGRDVWAFIITIDGRVIPTGAQITDGDGTIYSYGYPEVSRLFGGNEHADACDENHKIGCGGRLLRNNWKIDW